MKVAYAYGGRGQLDLDEDYLVDTLSTDATDAEIAEAIREMIDGDPNRAIVAIRVDDLAAHVQHVREALIASAAAILEEADEHVDDDDDEDDES